MCLILAAPTGVPIKPEHITRAWESNDDGAGVAFVVDGVVHTIKGLMKLEHLEQVLDAVGTDVPRLVHLRFATLGAVTPQNTHPFELLCGAVVAHNGPSINSAFTGDDDRSDSRHFAEEVLAPLPACVLRHLKPVWEGFIEPGNKLAFLFPDGEFMLVNEDLGKWEDGVWLSSPHYVSPTFSRGSLLKGDLWGGHFDYSFTDASDGTGVAVSCYSVGTLHIERGGGEWDSYRIYYDSEYEVGPAPVRMHEIEWMFSTADGALVADLLLDAWNVGLQTRYESLTHDKTIASRLSDLMAYYGAQEDTEDRWAA